VIYAPPSIRETRKLAQIIASERGPANCVFIEGFDPKGRYTSSDAKELATLFAGVEKLLTA